MIAGLLESGDVLRTAEALRQFGIRVEQFGPTRWSCALRSTVVLADHKLLHRGQCG